MVGDRGVWHSDQLTVPPLKPFSIKLNDSSGSGMKRRSVESSRDKITLEGAVHDVHHFELTRIKVFPSPVEFKIWGSSHWSNGTATVVRNFCKAPINLSKDYLFVEVLLSSTTFILPQSFVACDKDGASAMGTYSYTE